MHGYHEESRTVFEFYGCYWHGCPTHFPDRNRVQHHQCLTMHQLYILTIGKSEDLRRAGYQVMELWECDYDKRYKEDPDFRSLVDSEFTNLDPLRPRDALFGGRTNSTKQVHRCVFTLPICLQVRTVSTWTSHHLFSREY